MDVETMSKETFRLEATFVFESLKSAEFSEAADEGIKFSGFSPVILFSDSNLPQK